MKLIKLTDEKMTTYNDMEWIVGEAYSKEPCNNPELCTSEVFHAYTNLNLALLLNPIHANYDTFRIFEAEGDIVVSDYGKVGTFDLTLTNEVDIPEWYTDLDSRHKIQVLFAVMCAESVIHIYEQYSDDDRPRKAIEAAKEYLNNLLEDAARAADAAAYAARAADAAYAAYAAYAAAYAADAAARVARVAYAAADAAYAAYAAARAADAAAYAAARAADAAYAAAGAADAAYAAYAAAGAADSIDFASIADTSVSIILNNF